MVQGMNQQIFCPSARNTSPVEVEIVNGSALKVWKEHIDCVLSVYHSITQMGQKKNEIDAFSKIIPTVSSDGPALSITAPMYTAGSL